MLDSISTGRSSVFTKMGSTSDMSMDVDVEDCREGGMTIDEALDMYSAGFEDDDDVDPEEGDAMESPSPEETQRRSREIAEAMGSGLGPTLPGPHRPPTPEVPAASAPVSADGSEDYRAPPPPLRRPDQTHDQYGFRKVSRDITLSQYDAHHQEYSGAQARRRAKWEKLLKEQGLPTEDPVRFPRRSAQVQRFIRKGIPPAWRGGAWFFYAGGDDLLLKHPNLYSDLVRRAETARLNAPDRESIERDLHRTFPDNLHFKGQEGEAVTPTLETPLLSSLRRVLRAFAIHNPRIGYCQSLNFIAGLLLLFLPEEKAFWMLHVVAKKILPGTHDLSLEGANIDLWVLMLALQDAVPSVWAKVGGEVRLHTLRLPPISLCTTAWFMSLFIGTLPVESVLRVWDILFYEGSRTLFRIAVAVFRLGENEIRSVGDPMEMFQVVQSIPRRMLDIDRLLGTAMRTGGVSQQWVEKKRKERKEWYRLERIVERRRKESRDLGKDRVVQANPSEEEAAQDPGIWQRAMRAVVASPVSATFPSRRKPNKWW
jgi:TBC1 domain family member 6